MKQLVKFGNRLVWFIQKQKGERYWHGSVPIKIYFLQLARIRANKNLFRTIGTDPCQ